MASTAGPPEVVRTRVRPVAGQPGSVPYDASLIFALTHCVGHKVVVQVSPEGQGLKLNHLTCFVRGYYNCLK